MTAGTGLLWRQHAGERTPACRTLSPINPSGACAGHTVDTTARQTGALGEAPCWAWSIEERIG